MNAARMLAIALVGLLVLGVFYAGPAPPSGASEEATAPDTRATTPVPAEPAARGTPGSTPSTARR